MLSEGTRKRISRVARRAIPAVREAFERGEISAKRADLLLYLSPARQKKELARRLNETAERERRHRLVAKVIHEYLDSLNGQKPDLSELAVRLRETLKGAGRYPYPTGALNAPAARSLEAGTLG